MKIVKFKDGQYGIRRFNFWWCCYEYRDLVALSDFFWWPLNSKYFDDSKGPLCVVKEALIHTTIFDKGVVCKTSAHIIKEAKIA